MNRVRQYLAACFVVLAACLLLGAGVGRADPRDGHKREMERRGRGHGSEPEYEEKGPGHKHAAKHGRHRHRVEYKGEGPPPWAEAHGYRRQLAPVATGYVAPHQIEVGRCKRETVGAVLGGAAGGVLGSKVGGGVGRDVAVMTGTVLGVVVGGEIGRWMDDVDQACAAQTLEFAGAERGVEWVDPDNGNMYQVTPTETYLTDSNRYCREYRAKASVGGSAREVYGTACRHPDGSWQLVK